jgi:hypothetical protein
MRMLVEVADQGRSRSEPASSYRPRARYSAAAQSKHRANSARRRAPRACNGGLHLHTPAAALAVTRHHHRRCQRSPAESAQGQNVDAQGLAAPCRLDRARHAARILNSLPSSEKHSQTRARFQHSLPRCDALDCSKTKSTTKCPPRDFSSSCALRERAHLSLRMRHARNARQFATKASRQKHCEIKMLLGWGGRIRTSAWRNQNPLPYHLATPHRAAHPLLRRADHSGGFGTDQCRCICIGGHCLARASPASGIHNVCLRYLGPLIPPRNRIDCQAEIAAAVCLGSFASGRSGVLGDRAERPACRPAPPPRADRR